MQIDDPLVDSHLEPVPSFGTLTARSFPGGDAQNLGRHTYWSLYLQFLLLSGIDEIGAHFFQGTDVTGSQCNSYVVDGRGVLAGFFGVSLLYRCLQREINRFSVCKFDHEAA